MPEKWPQDLCAPLQCQSLKSSRAQSPVELEGLRPLELELEPEPEPESERQALELERSLALKLLRMGAE
jgi:hypothetical protein